MPMDVERTPFYVGVWGVERGGREGRRMVRKSDVGDGGASYEGGKGVWNLHVCSAAPVTNPGFGRTAGKGHI